MPEIGQTIAHYRIVEKLGAGGMGVVYRAEDTNLDRQVAIKVLPDIFSGDPERLARFEREAKLLASLNHPNIAAIHGLEEAGGKRFLVLELVEGETLAQHIAKGPLPPDEALEVCRQIAEGVEAAHEKGIIHRDLKPANVKITPEGKVKVLDFGLAKAFHDETTAAQLSHSPTLTDQMTRPGVILGTAAYMSPEQAKGKPVDRRSDIWAFGCILYECLTGRRAFEGETVTETLASILKGEPDWQALPATIPSRVTDLLRRCLQKNPHERMHDIADARIEIGRIEPGVPEAVVPARRIALRWALAAASAALLAGSLLTAAWMRYFAPVPAGPAMPVVKATIQVEPGLCLDGLRRAMEFQRPSRTAMAIASDGRFVVYSAIEMNGGPEAKSRLYLRRTDQLEATPIQGTEGGIAPFLSPDNRVVAFWAGAKLMKVSVDGGVPAALCDTGYPFGASWGTDNGIVFSSNDGAGLSRISADGGTPEVLTTPDKSAGEYSHRLPHCLPGGKGVLFTIMQDIYDIHPRVALLNLSTRKWSNLLNDAADARYVPTGHLVFMRQGTLMAVRFDLDKLAPAGQPVPAIANVMQTLNVTNSAYHTAAGQFSVSGSGGLVYASGGMLPNMENSLVWVDRTGTTQPVTSSKESYFAPRLSPDGRRIAYSTMGMEWRVWVYDLLRGTKNKFPGDFNVHFVDWAPPDGKRMVFGEWRSGISNIYWQPVDGNSPIERLTTNEFNQSPGSLSPNGETLALVTSHPSSGYDISLLQIRDRREVPFLNSRFNEAFPEISPDGRWLAYTSDETGREEVYVQSFPGKERRWPISSEGGTQPLWARSGKELFFRRSNQVWAVDFRADTDVPPGKPHLLFDQPGFAPGGPQRSYDVSLDGKGFLMVKLEERKPQPVTEMILVQNWFEELNRLVPPGKK